MVGIDAEKAGAKVFARHDGIETHSLWGELAFQLRGQQGLQKLVDIDDPRTQPDEGLVASLLPPGPVLILLDEIVLYMAALDVQAQGNLLAFLSKLTSVVAKRPQAGLVVTDAAERLEATRIRSKT